MKTPQDDVVHAQRTAWEFSSLGFHHEDANVPRAVRTISCRMHVASGAGWATALMGARQSPGEGDGIPQTGRSPRLARDPTSQAGYPRPIPQQGHAGSAAAETRKGLAVSGCPPERVVNVQRSGVATHGRSRGPAGASPPGRRHLLGSLSYGLAS